jgi:hypothetical protein
MGSPTTDAFLGIFYNKTFFYRFQDEFTAEENDADKQFERKSLRYCGRYGCQCDMGVPLGVFNLFAHALKFSLIRVLGSVHTTRLQHHYRTYVLTHRM